MSITPPALIDWQSFLCLHAQDFDFIKTDKLIGNRYALLPYKDRKDLLDLRDGALYLELSEDHMMRLFLESAFTRPAETFCRLSFHICLPLSIPFSVLYAIRKENRRRTEFPWLPPRSKPVLAAVAVLRTIVDIVRLPYYGTLLTIYAFAATYFYFKDAGNSEKQFITMMEWRSTIARVEREMVWHDHEKCYTKKLQPLDFLHRVPRFCETTTQDPYRDGLDECVRRRNKRYHTLQAVSPLSRFLWKIPNFFSHSIV